jgi:hypothetical protein
MNLILASLIIAITSPPIINSPPIAIINDPPIAIIKAINNSNCECGCVKTGQCTCKDCPLTKKQKLDPYKEAYNESLKTGKDLVIYVNRSAPKNITKNVIAISVPTLPNFPFEKGICVGRVVNGKLVIIREIDSTPKILKNRRVEAPMISQTGSC